MQILVDSFKVDTIDKEGKLYTNVSRAYMSSGTVAITLDYNSVLCRLQPKHAVEVRIFRGVNEDIECHYLVLGRVYSVEHSHDRVLVKASFGGLLLLMDAPEERVRGIGDKDEVSLALTFI